MASRSSPASEESRLYLAIRLVVLGKFKGVRDFYENAKLLQAHIASSKRLQYCRYHRILCGMGGRVWYSNHPLKLSFEEAFSRTTDMALGISAWIGYEYCII